MGVDLHRIGTGISSGTSRNGFGNIVSFPSASGFPAAGTFISWANDLPYPAANGGAEVSIINNSTTYYYPNQIADFQVQADGAGGSYTNFNTATNVEFAPYGGNIVTFTTNLYITVGGNCGDSQSVPNGTNNDSYYHDGTGSYFSGGGNTYPSAGTILGEETCYNYDEYGNQTGYTSHQFIADGSGSFTTNSVNG